MPILKKDEPLTERPVVIAIYGEPGIRKTSVAQTADHVLLLDFDRGVARSYGRQDVLIVSNWDEVLEEERKGTYKQYKTVAIDTAKAALDDFLMNWVIRMDPKLKTNKLGAYGALGDEFKRFINACREGGTDIIILAHSKKDEDTHKQIPDVTGQSYNLITRIADQIGFISSQYNKPSIQWTPTDVTVGKNTANLPVAEIPDKGDPAFRTFMSDIIAQVKKAIVEMSEAQKEALEKSTSYQKQLKDARTADGLNMLITPISVLPKTLKDPLFQIMRTRSVELGLTWDKDAKQFTGGPAETEPTKQEPAQKEPIDHDGSKTTAPAEEPVKAKKTPAKSKAKKSAPVGEEQPIAFDGQ